MATAPTQMDTLSQLVSLLGGTKTTSNAGNTAGLESVLAQLQAQNAGGYQQLLDSIFQQAAGAIPGFQNAFSSAVGARGSSRNSAMEVALSNLLKQTTLAGQQQIAGQQNQNLQTQTQAANSIAQATKGTTQQAGTNVGNAAKNLAIIAALDKLKLGDKWDSLTSMLGGGGAVDMAGFQQPYVAPSYMGDASSAQEFQSILGTQNYNTPAFTDFSSLPSDYLTPDFGTVDPQLYPDFVGPPETMPTLDLGTPIEEEFIDYGDYYADGGLVRNFADGGSVPQYAAGSRRSSAPSYSPAVTSKTAVDNTLPREALATPAPAVPVAATTAPTPTSSTVLGGVTLTDTLNAGNQGGNISFNENMSPQDAARNRSILGTFGDISSLAGLTGNTAIPGMGLMSGLARARTDEDAVKTIGLTAANMVAPGLGSLASIAMDPTKVNTTNALSMLTPVTAVANLGMKAFGTSIGEQLWGGPQRLDPKTGDVTREAVQGLFGDPVASVSPVAGWNTMDVTDLGQLGSDTSSRGNGVGGYGGSNYGGSASGISGGFQSSFGSGSLGGPGGSLGTTGDGGDGLADGGPIKGRGNGLEDNKQIRVSGGEFVISKDVVDAIGVDFFEALQQALHTPASIQRAMA